MTKLYSNDGESCGDAFCGGVEQDATRNKNKIINNFIGFPIHKNIYDF